MKKLFLLAAALVALGWGAGAQTAEQLRAKGDATSLNRLAMYHTLGCQGAELDSAKAFQLFQQAAQMGCADAQVHQAGFYLRGTGVPKDTAQAVRILQEQAAKGNGFAMARLALYYGNGTGLPKDKAKSAELYAQAEKTGDAYALYRRSLQYEFGQLGLKKDLNRALALAQQAAKKGCIWGYYQSASIYFRQENYKQMWVWIEKALAYNDPDARSLAGICYINGFGVAQDAARGEALLKGVLEQIPDDDYAAQLLCHYYFNTLNDKERAFAVLTASAEAGNANGWYWMGELTHHGIPPFADTATRNAAYRQIRAYWDKAYAMGSSFVCSQLGRLYLNGEAFPADTAKAIEIFLYGVEEGEEDCPVNMSVVCYQQGDIDKAIEYLNLAIERGNLDAYDMLRRIYVEREDHAHMMCTAERAIADGYLDGYAWQGICYGEMGNQKKAVAACAKGAKLGSLKCTQILSRVYENDGKYKKSFDLWKQLGGPVGQYEMAALLLSGNMGDPDIEKGLSLLNQSANGGYAKALEALGSLYAREGLPIFNPQVAIGYYQRLADMGESEGLFMIGNLYEDQDDSAQCLAYYRRAAEAGHGDAWRFLGEFYMQGHWLPCDSVEAFRCYTKAMELGEPAGYDFVGQSYLRGIGVEKDTLKALPFILKAARMGMGRDCAFVGKAFSEGLFGMEQNADSALYYYKIGSDNDDPECDFQIGAYLIRGGNQNGLGFISAAARNGHEGAQVVIAECIANGVGVPKADPEQGYGMLERLALENRNAEAFMKIGAYRCYGKGCQQDFALARLYFDTAAQMGNTVAMSNLASMYFDGMGVEIDSTRGIAYLQQAADLDDLDAINKLGDLYEAREDYKQAVACYERGVALGSNIARCNLGVCYQEGNGVILNSKRAYELFLEAAENGNARGMYHVGMCYMDEVYVSDDIDQAVLWLTRAADNGHTLSCYILGMLYANGAENSQGQSLKPDKKKAKLYLQQAAENDFQPAVDALKKL